VQRATGGALLPQLWVVRRM